MKAIAIIPARGGSKGIPKKNLIAVNGQPLIKYSIDAALHSGLFSRVIVSTDSLEIEKFAASCGCEVSLRPAALATDSSLIADTIDFTLGQLLTSDSSISENDFFALLEPTSPLRSFSTLKECVSCLRSDNVKSVASISENDIPASRLWMLSDHKNTRLSPAIKEISPWLPRQKHQTCYRFNGLFYGSKIDWFLNREVKHEIISRDFSPVITPLSFSVDIDTLLDLKLVELIMSDGGFSYV